MSRFYYVFGLDRDLYNLGQMKKFFDSRRELVSSGPGSGVGGGGAGSGGGGSFIGRVFTIGRHQVTIEEIVAEGEFYKNLLSGSNTWHRNTFD